MLFGVLSLFVAAVAAYPARGSCTGDCQSKDPAVIQRSSDGTYFRFGTGTGVVTLTAPSIKGPWKNVGAALPDGSSMTVDGVDPHDIWAPDVHKDGDTYYLYYVLSKLGTQTSNIGVATSKTLEPGSWTDHGAIGLPANSAYNRIDPNWIDIGGKQYLQFGSYWQDIFQVPMESPLKVGSVAPYQVAFNGSLNHRVEGSFLYKNGAYYYLFFSAGLAGGYTKDTPAPGEEYSIRVCRSSSGTGGFVDKAGNDCKQGGGTFVLASHDQVYGPGGQGVLNDKDVGPAVYYHFYPISLKEKGGSNGNDGYQFAWSALDFASGWPVVKAA